MMNMAIIMMNMVIKMVIVVMIKLIKRCGHLLCSKLFPGGVEVILNLPHIGAQTRLL